MELTFKSAEISRNISLMLTILVVSYGKSAVETMVQSYGIRVVP